MRPFANPPLPLLLLLSLASAGIAQESGDGGAPERQINQLFETTATGPAAGLNNSLSQFLTALVATEPARVAPGSGAKLRILLQMRVNSVIPQEGRIELEYEKKQGGLSFGNWSVSPPELGKFGKSWLGKKVYDDTMVIDLLFAAGADLGPGPQEVKFTLSADVYRGDNGQVVGRGRMPVFGTVTVERAAAKAPADDKAFAEWPPEYRPQAGDPGTEPTPVSGTPQPSAPAGASAPATVPAPGVPAPGADTAMNWLLPLGGGIALGALATLLLVRRRP
ncbi:MAG: hypothetical protein U1E73_11115 [Planctomycetota bacterium]